MKYLKSYKLFESRFLEFREILSTIKDICQEFEDNNCKCEIEPNDDIQLNIISLKSRGHLSSMKTNFYLDINIDRRIQTDERRSGMGPFPSWFIDTCKRIEEFMSSEGFKTLPSIKYPTDWENFDSVDELEYAIGLIQKVRLKFVPTAKPLDESLEYNADWKRHDSQIRKELELDLNDILLEINDLGFKSHISGWIKGNDHPYVWIRRTTYSPVPMKDYTHETVERIKDYLSQKGYQTKVDVINVDRPAMQIYIYFDKELKDDNTKYIDIEHLRESVESDEVRKDIEEICYDLTDYDKFRVDIRYNMSYSSRTGKDENRWVIFISLKNHLDYDGFLLSEVEDVLMRIKSYLSERRYLGCEVVKVGEPHKSAMRYVTDEDRLTSIFIYYTL